MRFALATVLLACLLQVWLATPSEARGSACDVGGGGSGGGIVVRGVCIASETDNGGASTVVASAAPATKTIVCGYPSSADNGFWNPKCGAPRDCPSGPAFATFIQQNGTWVLLDSWCAGDPAAPQQPVLTTAALREQVLRLLPPVQIGSAWATRALVNAEAVLWAETRTNRDLGTVTVVGQPVALRIGFDHADWSFGDGTGDSTNDPGKAYTESDPCGSAQCADYYGHTYRNTGAVTISLRVAWHAQFSLDNGTTWTDVDPAPLTGPAATHTLQIVQARGILVQNP